MNTINELLSSNKEEKETKEETEIKTTIVEEKVLKNRERKQVKLDENYQELSNLNKKTGIKILSFLAPFLGTIMGVAWSLFSVGIEKEKMSLILGLLVSTAIGNIIGGIISLRITNDELSNTELDMYKSMKHKNMETDFNHKITLKELNDLKVTHEKLLIDTEKLRKENDERILEQQVQERLRIKEKEINDRVEEEVNKRVELRLKEQKRLSKKVVKDLEE